VLPLVPSLIVTVVAVAEVFAQLIDLSLRFFPVTAVPIVVSAVLVVIGVDTVNSYAELLIASP
jgi:PIN domain nuclease of toxin-antitoxin system